MKVIENRSGIRRWLSALFTTLAVVGCTTPVVEKTVEPVASRPSEASPMGLLGEWCRENKRRVTQYTVKEGKLNIRSGRSGQLHEVDIICNDTLTTCEARTVRGWGTPVTETLHLDGENMNLTRVWGGAWNDKTYNFTYTRCPKW